ncbi:acyl-homoserine-lactone acylase [Amycolatopsis xylanica]|uniref:Acyl-homoserine-lactone acylase n=1 Tax=Amycolatopsis xylanica TaxID=589385 RepID=A0A1H3AE60_9PSEU|nr:penicillin acylase family protein [Amycolatopsis xylanica]SDX27454.1 acyl-homoserine-lactone acylase [Amycolatopsis xylanica]
MLLRKSLILTVALGLIGAVPATASPAPTVIRYTEYGIPHIVAKDYESLGYGQGYAAARDNLCAIEETALTTSASRSAQYGPDAVPIGMLTRASTNLSSDLYFQRLNDNKVVDGLLSQVDGDIRDAVRGYANGVNKFLKEATDPTCKAWARPITEIDIYRHQYATSLAFGQGGEVDAITGAQPGKAPEPVDPDFTIGSNAIAIGGAASANGRGISLANPHLPWQAGSMRMWQSQLTIPGKLNVMGVGMAGQPFLWMGHNETAAWSGTATDATRTYTLFKVKLASSTSYLVDGRPEQMRRDDVTVSARQPDGSLKQVTKPQWSTRYGPVTRWEDGFAYAFADANAQNLRLTNTLAALAKAKTADAIIEATRRTQGLPWMNILATDDHGKLGYTQTHSAPNVTDAKAAQCNTSASFQRDGLAVLDGSRSDCAWGTDRDALRPGVFGPANLPVLKRDDYFENSNDSYWIMNPAQPLTGFARIVGPVETERKARTRDGFTEIADQLAKAKFTGQSMRDLMFSNRNYIGEQVAGDTVKMCRELALGKACDALAAWDKRNDVDSRGVLLFDRFWDRATDNADIWQVPFDPKDPINTPNTLKTGDPKIRQALIDSVAELNAGGIPLDAKWGDTQYVTRGGKRIPMSGGTARLGVFNSIGGAWDPKRGYTEMVHGATYLHVVTFAGPGRPEASTVLAYSQSADPRSPHYSDQTELYSKKQWVKERFSERDIAAGTVELKILR